MRLVWLMPVEDIVKHILSWILPLPAILIVLALSYYGPPAPLKEAGWPAMPVSQGRVFLFGILSAFAIYALVPVTKFLVNHLTGRQGAERGDDEEEF